MEGSIEEPSPFSSQVIAFLKEHRELTIR